MHNRDVRPFVTVELNPPPCERTFRLWYRAGGELSAVEIDDVFFSVRRLKGGHRAHLDGTTVTLVDVVVNLPVNQPDA